MEIWIPSRRLDVPRPALRPHRWPRSPRIQPFDRLRAETFNAGRIVTSKGRVATSTGQQAGTASSAGCCCPKCSDCPDATPRTWLCTFTLITLCAGCLADALGITCFQWDDGANLNQTVELTHPDPASTCIWTGTLSASAKIWGGSVFGPPTCVGPAGGTVSTFTVTLMRNTSYASGVFGLGISANYGSFSWTGSFFAGTVSSTDCTADLTIANTLTGCAPNDIGSYGGSAALTPNA